MMISAMQPYPHLILFVMLLLIVYPLQGSADELYCTLTHNRQVTDYNDWVAQGNDPNVWGLHFNSKVERLERGSTTDDPMGDLDYVLRAMPNYPRVLWAVSRYEREGFAMKWGGMNRWPPAECYFRMAIKFRPKDPAVHMVFGTHLHLSGKLDEALKEYKLSEQIFSDSPELHYNMGLLYFDRKEYTLAKQHAQKAYQLGYPLPGLRNKLKNMGQWP